MLRGPSGTGTNKGSFRTSGTTRTGGAARYTKKFGTPDNPMVPLACSYRQKDDAKRLGATWDPKTKTWNLPLDDATKFYELVDQTPDSEYDAAVASVAKRREDAQAAVEQAEANTPMRIAERFNVTVWDTSSYGKYRPLTDGEPLTDEGSTYTDSQGTWLVTRSEIRDDPDTGEPANLTVVVRIAKTPEEHESHRQMELRHYAGVILSEGKGEKFASSEGDLGVKLYATSVPPRSEDDERFKRVDERVATEVRRVDDGSHIIVRRRVGGRRNVGTVWKVNKMGQDWLSKQNPADFPEIVNPQRSHSVDADGLFPPLPR